MKTKNLFFLIFLIFTLVLYGCKNNTLKDNGIITSVNQESVETQDSSKAITDKNSAENNEMTNQDTLISYNNEVADKVIEEDIQNNSINNPSENLIITNEIQQTETENVYTSLDDSKSDFDAIYDTLDNI